MAAYMFELRDSDGNDCTVYDVIVEAAFKDEAVGKVFAWIQTEYPGDEEDGDFGTYHPCDCECDHGVAPHDCEQGCGDSWECSHGGLLVSEDADEYPTLAAARDAHKRDRYYHSLIELDA